jgi:ketosteroid isomerase-like protein
MSKGILRLAAVSAMLSLLACERTPAQDPQRLALEGAIQRWTKAVNAQDLATLKATMTEDIELSDGDSTVTGSDAAMSALRELVSRGKLVVATREITMAGDIGWHVAGLAQSRKSGVLLARGQVLEIWKRVNGEWRLHRRMATGTPVTDIPLTRPSPNEPVLDQPKS